MPLYHCDSCHHEWEGSRHTQKCDWCDSGAYVLAAQTGLEQMIQSDFWRTRAWRRWNSSHVPGSGVEQPG